MSTLLFEIGTEELPSDVVVSGERQLAAHAGRLLAAARLTFERIETFATPRRLAVLVHGLSERQAPARTERRGPPASRAFDESGALTPAGAGFAKSAGVAPEQLVRRDADGGEYVFAIIEESGAAAVEVLPGLLGEVAASLAFPKTMRWDASGVRFPRPVRWLVAQLDDQVVPATFGSVRAGRSSRGHRVFHPGEVEIAAAGAYVDALREAGVLAVRAERQDVMLERAREAATALGGRPVPSPEVLEEVTDLVEMPVPLIGRFADKYLEIPRDVIVTAMETHLRQFPVEDPDGNLVAGFVAVSNGDSESASLIVTGNERVLRARLEDARFFWLEDLKTPLTVRAEGLKELVVHGKLGTMHDKSERLASLVQAMSRWMGLDEVGTTAAVAAARVCKADLLSQLVYEFPELEGAMGREYARRDPNVAPEAAREAAAVAIAEHYLPRRPDDELPRTAAGAALGLADRLDTLVGYVGIGSAPSGSEDPFGLRRQAAGFVALSLDRDARVPLDEAVQHAHDLYGADLAPVSDVTAQLRDILAARASALLEAEGLSRIVIEAAARSNWTDLPDVAARARALGRAHERGVLHPLAVAHERAWNLSRQATTAEVDSEAFEHPSEQALYEKIVGAEAQAPAQAGERDYDAVLETLGSLRGVIDDFFDRERGVMVMVDDDRMRTNRLALLERITRLFALVADLSGVHPAELE